MGCQAFGCRKSCFALIPAILALIAAVLAFFGASWCDLVVIEPRDSVLPEFKTGLLLYTKTEVDFDPAAVSVEESCSNVLYTSSGTDGRWKAAVSLQIVSVAIGLILAVVLFTAAFVGFQKAAYYGIGTSLVVICCTCTGLIFLVMDSKLCKSNPVLAELGISELYRNDCKISDGSIIIIVSLVVFFLAGLTTCCIPGTNRYEDQAEDAKEEETPAEKDIESAEDESAKPQEAQEAPQETEEEAAAAMEEDAAEPQETEAAAEGA